MNTKKQILIADINLDSLQKLQSLVTKLLPSAKIITAVTERDVSHKLNAQRFDLFICDLSITRGQTTTFLEKVIGPFADPRPDWSLILSSEPKPSNLSNFKKNTFIPKPIDEAFFSEIVHTVCGTTEENAKGSSPIDVNFINPFIEATLKVLSTTANTEAKKKSVCIRKENQISGDISSLIAMNSERYLGSMAISFDEKCFLAVVSNMLGENYTAISDEIQDAVGELCNQIFGQAKMVLNQKGHTIQPAIPSIISGKAHKIKHLIVGTCIAVVFETPHGDFVIETVMRAKQADEG